jgi:hypothetical protein
MRFISTFVVMFMLSSAGVFAADNLYDAIEKLKGVNIEVVITESNKSETGVLTSFYLMAAPQAYMVNFIMITNDKGEQVYIPASSIKSIKVVSNTGVKPGSKK